MKYGAMIADRLGLPEDDKLVADVARTIAVMGGNGQFVAPLCHVALCYREAKRELKDYLRGITTRAEMVTRVNQTLSNYGYEWESAPSQYSEFIRECSFKDFFRALR